MLFLGLLFLKIEMEGTPLNLLQGKYYSDSKMWQVLQEEKTTGQYPSWIKNILNLQYNHIYEQIKSICIYKKDNTSQCLSKDKHKNQCSAFKNSSV